MNNKQENTENRLLSSSKISSPSKKTEMVINFFKENWKFWTLISVFLGLAIIFILAIVSSIWQIECLSIPFTEKTIDLKIFDALQKWVGFSLGIIATLFSIISMYLSFYNLEQQMYSESKVRELNEEMKKTITTEIIREMRVILPKELEEIKKSLNIIREEQKKAVLVDTKTNSDSKYEEEYDYTQGK